MRIVHPESFGTLRINSAKDLAGTSMTPTLYRCGARFLVANALLGMTLWGFSMSSRLFLLSS